MNTADDTSYQQRERRRYLLGEIGGALVAAAAVACWGLSASAQALPTAESHNMKLLGHDPLQARSAYQPVIQEQNGRWIAYVGHHGGPMVPDPTSNGALETNGTSIVDVTNPRRPVYLAHLPPTDGTSAQFVQTCRGDDLDNGIPGATYLLRGDGNEGHEIWNVTDPENPAFVSDVTSGLNGTHKNWWDCETGIAYLVADLRPAWSTNRGLKIYDLNDPANPVFIRNFGMVGSEPGATEAPVRDPGVHEATVLGNRVYLAYGTSGEGAMQIIDRDALLNGPSDPTPENLLAPVIAQLNMPDYWGGHTAWAMHGVDLPEYEFFEEGTPRDFVILTSESTSNSCEEPMHHMTFMVDVTDEAHPFPVANYQVPESEGEFCDRGGRFGTHSQNWSYTDVFYKKLVFFSYFNAGVRAVDVRDPYHPEEVGFFIPATTENTDVRRNGAGEEFFAIQTNNVEVDDRGYVYLADRANTGLHIVGLTGQAKQIAGLR